MEKQNKAIEEFNKVKIYEKLDYKAKPENYTNKLSWIVQQQIAATNGIQYIDRIGKLSDYPVYELPVKENINGLMLDIGNGWGRWLLAGANKGYIPVGIDIRLEFCETALHTLHANEKNGYSAVADLKELPFKANVFDLVWSFSVIQHTHKERMVSCLKHIKRILKGDGFAMLEFPNKNGIRNYFGPSKKYVSSANDYNSWDVRYYSVKEYKNIFLGIFQSFQFNVHSALGIGVLKEDMKYVSFKNKILCGVSLVLTGIFKIIKPLKKFADSIYITVNKNGHEKNTIALEQFLKAHNTDPKNNLNIVHLLQCPITGENVSVSEDEKFIINSSGAIKYPIKNNIPILIRTEAIINN